jgi:hypothetical protein
VCIVLLPVAGIIIIVVVVVAVGALYQFLHVYGSLIISITPSAK